MNTQPSMIRLPGMSRLDALELCEEYDSLALQIEDDAMSDGSHGELATTAVVIVSVVAIKAIAAWLIKNRKSERINRTIEIINADGSRHVETISIDLHSSTSPSQSVIKELGRLCNIDLSLLNSPE